MVDDVRLPKPDKKYERDKEKKDFQRYEPKFVPPEFIKEHSGPVVADHSKFAKKEKRKQRTPIVKHLKDWWNHLKPEHRVLSLSILVFGLFVAAGITKAYWPVPQQLTEPPVVILEPEPEPPTTVASKLTGLQVKPNVNKRPVIAVMVENSPDARPQSGLFEAGVVYEAIAEGGITRFMALFLDNQTKYVGPVRSARPYYLHWLLPYDAPYAHVGGSPNAISDIIKLGVKDLDQFANPGQYQRVSSRYAPHNVYTGIDKLTSLAASKGWHNSDTKSFARLEEATIPKAVKVNTIALDISSDLYNVSYTYHQKSNSYKRTMGGQKHLDEQLGNQISPKVVIALITNQGYEPDGLHLTYKTTGTGTVYVFQNGKVTKGTWSKSGSRGRLKLLNKKGVEIELEPGQVWITALTDNNQVSYK